MVVRSIFFDPIDNYVSSSNVIAPNISLVKSLRKQSGWSGDIIRVSFCVVGSEPLSDYLLEWLQSYFLEGYHLNIAEADRQSFEHTKNDLVNDEVYLIFGLCWQNQAEFDVEIVEAFAPHHIKPFHTRQALFWVRVACKTGIFTLKANPLLRPSR